MKRNKKRICVVLIVVLLLNFVPYENICLADNEEYNEELYVSEPFIDERDNYDYIDKKIEDDIKSETGIVSSEVEEMLNEQGYFDDDIEMLSESDVNALEESDISEGIVYTEYYAVPDIKEADNINVEEAMIPLTPEEVDMLIESKYYGKENNLDEVVYERVNLEQEDTDSLLEKSIEVLGLKPQNVYAENAIEIGGVNDKNHYSYLKKSLYFNKTKHYYLEDGIKKNYYILIGTTTWTKMPINRLLDIYQLTWNANLCFDIANMDERALWRKQGIDLSPRVVKAHDTEKFYVEKNGDGSKKGYSMTRHIQKEQTRIGYGKVGDIGLKNGEYIINDSGIVGANDLLNDKSIATDDRISYTNYYNESIKITVYLKDNSSKSVAYIYFNYNHLKAKAVINTVGVIKIARIIVNVVRKNWKQISVSDVILVGDLNKNKIIKEKYYYDSAGIDIGSWLVPLR